MDNSTAKEILSAYRPSGIDAQDKNFSDALAQCQNDPAMRDWFSNEQRFDAAAAEALASVTVPHDGKSRLLQTPVFGLINTPEQGDSPAPKSKSLPGFQWSFGIAALLLLGLITVWQIVPRYSSPHLETETFSIAGLVKDAMPLSYRSDDSAEVLTWLAGRDAPVPEHMPDSLASAAAIGCRVFDVPGGGKISLLCLLSNGEVVHFFVFDEEASTLLANAPLNTWWEEDGWNMYSFEQGNQRIAVATQGSTHII